MLMLNCARRLFFDGRIIFMRVHKYWLNYDLAALSCAQYLKR
jgi:hypothetical protein